jgi:hypothetical protein
VKEVHYLFIPDFQTRWADSLSIASAILTEAGVSLYAYPQEL